MPRKLYDPSTGLLVIAPNKRGSKKMLTRKDFEWMAARIAVAVIEANDEATATTKVEAEAAYKLAVDLGHRSNEHFDEGRFRSRVEEYVSGARNPWPLL